MRQRALFSAYAILFLETGGYALLFPFFPMFMVRAEFQFFSPAIAETTRHVLLSIVLAAFPLAQFFGAPFFGDFSDVHGRKKAFLWTLSGTLLGYLLSIIALVTHSLWLLLMSRLVTGFFAGNIALSLAVVADSYPLKRERATHLGYMAAMLGVAWMAAIALGGPLAHSPLFLSLPSLPFWISLSLSLLSLLIALFIYKESAPPIEQQKMSLAKGMEHIGFLLETKHLITFYLVVFFWFLGVVTALQWAAPISMEKFLSSPRDSTWLLLLLGGMWAISAFFLNRPLLAVHSMWKITLWSLFFNALFLFFAAVADYSTYFSIAYLMAALFGALIWSNNLNMISVTADSSKQGKAMGVMESMQALAQMGGPFVGGFIAGFSLEPLLYTCAFCIFIAFIILLVHVLKRSNRSDLTLN